MNQKIAFLILAHNDPKMLSALVHALDYERFDIYIHVDAKSDINLFNFSYYNLRYSKLFILDNRERVYWGDYSIVQATLNMYRKASIREYCRYVTLSGNDYPLKSNDEIYARLTQNRLEYIMGMPSLIPEKVSNYYFNKLGFFSKFLTHLFAILHIKRNKKPLVINGIEHTIYFAPQWHALSNESVSYILNTIDNNKKTIERFFKYSFAPDELLIPTLIFNSKFKDNTLKSQFPKGTHYNEMPAIHYINYEPIVQVFDDSCFEDLINSGKLFARKLNSKTSITLIELLNDNIHNKNIDNYNN